MADILANTPAGNSLIPLFERSNRPLEPEVVGQEPSRETVPQPESSENLHSPKNTSQAFTFASCPLRRRRRRKTPCLLTIFNLMKRLSIVLSMLEKRKKGHI
jgi:hypothetical protein